MYYQQNLMVAVQKRRNRLYKAVNETYQNELKYLFEEINKIPYLRAIVNEMEALNPGIEWSTWKNDHFKSRTYSLPDNEAATAKICFGFMKDVAENDNALTRYRFAISDEGDTNAMLRDFTEQIVDPFINYLTDRIDEGNNVLSILEKYKRRVEWFHRDELFDKVTSAQGSFESIVDRDLREYLFDQGVDYPLSSPSSPSGRTDVVADVGEEKPLVLEIKLFDLERGYDRGYIRKGFRQIYEYARDYNQPSGYLVIFNCTPKAIVFNVKSKDKLWPPRITIDNHTFFLIVIDIYKWEEPASKRGPLQTYAIDEEYLTSIPGTIEEAATKEQPTPEKSI